MAADKWIQKADKKMESKGTKGKFGKATDKKIAAAKKEGGVEKKRAVFAENMKKIAKKHESKKPAGKMMKVHHGEHSGHKAIGSQTGYTMGAKKRK